MYKSDAGVYVFWSNYRIESLIYFVNICNATLLMGKKCRGHTFFRKKVFPEKVFDDGLINVN